MKTRAKLAMSAVVVAVLAGTAVAESGQRHDGHDGDGGHRGGHDMMQMMQRMHEMRGGGMMGDGMPMMGGMHGLSGMGLRSVLDEDGDGSVTPEEMRAGLNRLRTEYDANGDDVLSIDEFETLHSALIRERMVDRFQYLDADGDGQVTQAEMQAPADRMERMQAMRDRMMEHHGSAQGGMPGASQMHEGNGEMMNDDVMEDGGHGMRHRQSE